MAAAHGPPGCVATLVVPAELSWSECPPTALPRPSPSGARRRWPADVVEQAAAALGSGEPAALLIGGPALRRRGLEAAGRGGRGHRGQAPRASPSRPTSSAGRGCPPPERLSYLAEFVEAQLAGARHLVLAGTGPPVSFFAYPGRPGDLVPDGCEVHRLGGPGDDVPAALEHLAEALGAAPGAAATAPGGPPGQAHRAPLTLQTLAEAVGALLPEDAVVVDEANTAGTLRPGGHGRVPRATTGSPSPGGPSASACRRPPGPPWRLPADGCCASRPTGAPCTRPRPCGPRPARGST